MSSSSSSAPTRGHKRERAESPAAAHSRQKTSRRTEDADSNSSQSLPVAPTLATFLAPGGPTRYRPQPAWLAPAAATTTTTTTTRKSRRHHDYPDILAAASYEANERAAAAVAHETAAAANDWSPYESLSRFVWGVPPACTRPAFR
jgi:hypothetical protein